MDNSKVKFYIKDYFTFSSGEKVGVLVLVSLILLVLAAMGILSHLLPDNPLVDTAKFDKEITLFEKSQDTVKSKYSVQYRNQSSEKKTTAPVRDKSFKPIELNQADSAMLDELPGIGPSFSKRIIKYRSILGGYYTINQIYEVYGMKPETVERIQKYIKIDTTLIKKIDLNQAEFKEINAHPYISFEQTKSICKHRTKIKLLSIKQLEELGIFSAEELVKLRPYLIFK